MTFRTRPAGAPHRIVMPGGGPDVEVTEASSDVPVRVIDGPTLLAWCAD